MSSSSTSPDNERLEPNDTLDQGGTAEAQETLVNLPAGGALDSSETLAVTLLFPTQVVVFAGAEGSGKTTLLVSIYERLLEGPFSGFTFAGSRSLLGFEELCHMNRLSSGTTLPETPRTPPSENAAFYHLSLADEGVRREILFSAISGERFRLARDSSADCASLTFLRRANVLVVLVDGEKLSSLDTRENAVSDASGILRSFLDQNMLASKVRVEIVFSKFDCVMMTGGQAEEFIEKAIARLTGKFGREIPDLTFRKVAARPEGAELRFTHGVGEALRDWLKVSKQRLPDSVTYAAPDSPREFGRFGCRYTLKRGGS